MTISGFLVLANFLRETLQASCKKIYKIQLWKVPMGGNSIMYMEIPKLLRAEASAPMGLYDNKNIACVWEEQESSSMSTWNFTAAVMRSMTAQKTALLNSQYSSDNNWLTAVQITFLCKWTSLEIYHPHHAFAVLSCLNSSKEIAILWS